MCDRIPVVLEAAPGARAFYVRSGFREFDTIAWADQVDPVFIFEPEGMEGRCEPRGRGREEQLVGVVAPS